MYEYNIFMSVIAALFLTDLHGTARFRIVKYKRQVTLFPINMHPFYPQHSCAVLSMDVANIITFSEKTRKSMKKF